MALRVEHEDGVVLDALDEQPEALVVLRAPFLECAGCDCALLQNVPQHSFELLALFELRFQRAHQTGRALAGRNDV